MTSSATPPATERVRREWGRRIEAEYGSAALTQHFTLWLIQMGAAPDLIEDGLRIVHDELAHSRLSHQVYLDAGGTAPPQIDRRRLALEHRAEASLESDVVRVGVDIFCLGETVAVPLFAHMRSGCTVPVARRALDRILRDEVRHRDFGWALLDWMLESPHAEAVAAQVTDQLASLFSRVERHYGSGRGTDDAVTADERAWGLASAADYAAILDRTFERDWQPRFAERGIDATDAWSVRQG